MHVKKQIYSNYKVYVKTIVETTMDAKDGHMTVILDFVTYIKITCNRRRRQIIILVVYVKKCGETQIKKNMYRLLWQNLQLELLKKK